MADPALARRRAAPDEAIGDGVAHKAVTLDDFMARFCQERSKQNRICRKKALLAAARHGAVKLPELAVPHKHGRAKKQFVHDMPGSWQGFLDEGMDPPPPLPR